MTPWLIFGGGGQGVGALIVERALEQGRKVVALVRDDQAAARLEARGVQVVRGDACDDSAVAKACKLAGRGATIISSMGGAQDYLAHRTVIDNAGAAGIARMVMVTSLGCGDSWAWLSPRARAAFGQAVREKSLAESWLATSGMDFAILRPGGLLNGAATGKAERSQGVEVHGMVMRADVAAHACALADSPTLGGQIFSLVEPGLAP